MKSDIMQKELFKEFESHKKRTRKKTSGSILPKNYILFNISYEQVIFISIGVIMLMVLVFSLGVERGKHLMPAPAKKEKAASPEEKKEARKIEKIVSKKEPEAEEFKSFQAPVITKEKKIVNAELFTIQIIAYRSKRSAQKELIRLGKKGYSPFIILGGGYYQICVGEYKSKRAAEKALSELKKSHPDSFIRKR
jgi:septal ring-binding cell division protein DamX